MANLRNAIPDYPEDSSTAPRSSDYDYRRELHDAHVLAAGHQPDVLGAESPAAKRIASRRYRLYKRWMDIGLVLLASPLLLAVFGIVAAVVRFSSKGPIFYKHQRIGRAGSVFTMYKFRTMKVNSEQILLNHLLTNPAAREEWMHRHKLCQDPRLTASGRFLRTASLDELPQIWNVVRGDMSLVGPRPIIRAEVEKYGDRFCFYTAVLPGLTGLWQVSGRCNVTYPVRVCLDERYVCEWSLSNDLKILLKTPLTVCRREGAY